jgi:hypothetical protein
MRRNSEPHLRPRNDRHSLRLCSRQFGLPPTSKRHFFDCTLFQIGYNRWRFPEFFGSATVFPFVVFVFCYISDVFEVARVGVIYEEMGEYIFDLLAV